MARRLGSLAMTRALTAVLMFAVLWVACLGRCCAGRCGGGVLSRQQLRLVIGYSVGGGYDIYGRIAAEFLGRFIPGNPTILPQNLPGAGSMAGGDASCSGVTARRFSPRHLAQTLAARHPGARREGRLPISRQMPYIGPGLPRTSISDRAGRDADFRSTFDARQRQLSSSRPLPGSSPANIFPMALGSICRVEVQDPRSDIPGPNDMLLALERGEVDLVGANGLASTLAAQSRPDLQAASTDHLSGLAEAARVVAACADPRRIRHQCRGAIRASGDRIFRPSSD